VLVVVELALALMLLTGAGLLLRSFGRLLEVDTGVAASGVLTLQINVGNRAAQTVEESLDRIRAIPGVRAAAVTSQLPVTGRGTGAWLNIVDRPTKPNETPPAEAYRVVTPDYFPTMGIRLLRGRLPTPDDRVDHTPAVVVNEALAKRYWPNEDPIGKQVQLGAPGNYLIPPSPIVGIVANTPDGGLDAPPLPAVFLPLRVAPWWPAFSYVWNSYVLPCFFSASSVFLASSGEGRLSSTPKRPRIGHCMSFVRSIGATGCCGVISWGFCATPPP
jgi:hypothetical protein